MPAVSCIVAAAITLAVVGLANTCARAQSADLAIADKTPQVRKDKAKPVKKPDKNQYWLSEPHAPRPDAQFQYRPADQGECALHSRRRPFPIETDLVTSATKSRARFIPIQCLRPIRLSKSA
jgi:hypothetical protein